MRGFPGQLTQHGLNGGQSFVWTDVPYYLKAFFTMSVRRIGIFIGNEP